MIDIQTMQRINSARAEEWHKANGGISSWSALEWAGAMCGEAGEAANICKKLKRVDDRISGNEFSDHPLPLAEVDKLLGMLSDECADTFLYLLLVAERCGLDLEHAVVRRFNAKSAEMGFPQRLYYVE